MTGSRGSLVPARSLPCLPCREPNGGKDTSPGNEAQPPNRSELRPGVSMQVLPSSTSSCLVPLKGADILRRLADDHLSACDTGSYPKLMMGEDVEGEPPDRQ